VYPNSMFTIYVYIQANRRTFNVIPVVVFILTVGPIVMSGATPQPQWVSGNGVLRPESQHVLSTMDITTNFPPNTGNKFIHCSKFICMLL
jgi:hypothetical protein